MLLVRRVQNRLKKIRNRFDAVLIDGVARAVVKDKLTYLRPEKLRRILRALRETRRVPGDVLEFGVALGGSGVMLASHMGPTRKFHGFDVFGMIPPPTSDKDDAASKRRYETIQSGQSKGIEGGEYYGYRDDLLSDVKAAFSRHGTPVDGAKVSLHQGLFEDTWPTVEVGSISLVHIDCDWYDPVKYCLGVCADKLSDGGLMVIDDYYDWAGCRAAVDEFVAERKDFVFEAGMNPFLRKRATSAAAQRLGTAG
jgi:asparagine synthase (glutamine-hydrolysing)